ncbi:MAG: hypothetical protein ACRDV9_07535, partial [Acidimicrobiia bacterium]
MNSSSLAAVGRRESYSPSGLVDGLAGCPDTGSPGAGSPDPASPDAGSPDTHTASGGSSAAPEPCRRGT